MAGKPVSRILFCGRKEYSHAPVIIPLGPDSHLGSSSLPEGPNEPGQLSPPIWPCTTRGLPCRPDCSGRGGLLPHRFTLTVQNYLQLTCVSFRQTNEGFPSAGHRGNLRRRSIFCGTVRYPIHAACLRLPCELGSPGVTRRAALWVSGLSSRPAFSRRPAQRSPGLPANHSITWPEESE